MGTYVTKLSFQEVKSIFSIRLTLEGQALKAGIGKIPHETLRELKSIFNEEAKSKEHDPEYKTTDRIKIADDDFHNLIISSAEDRIISRAYAQIESFVLLLRNMNSREYISSKEHVDIIDAILAGNQRDASQMLEKHLRSVCNLSLENAEPE
jgi:DNA-binding GntR family transcriptional regulator